MSRCLDPKKIKSAQRVLEVMEYFTEDRQEATVMDIARSMGYPQSSTSELLSCLVALGYLQRDRYARTYRPSARVALLGAWVQPSFFRDGRLLPMMDELARQSGGQVVLAAQSNLEVQYLHVVSSAPHGEEDARDKALPLLRSVMGRVLLSTTNREHVRKLAHRINAESEGEHRVTFDTLVSELDDIRARGYGAGVEAQGATVGVLLPQATPHEQLALGLIGSGGVDEQTEDRFIQLLRGAVAEYLGPVAVTPPARFVSMVEPMRRYG